MLKENLFYSPLRPQSALALIRIIVGLFLIFHGLEVFDYEKLKSYTTWDVFKEYSYPVLMVGLGKGSEFVTGIMLTIGLHTRIASVIIAITFLYITFFVGKGKFWYEDQHPFLFVLLAMVFFFIGPGKYSMDHLLFNKKRGE